ncbi:MAG: alpha/beta hydrolase [Spirochaetaceae bacterium]|jgi:pimeloyl-ACP methyl ester carboxylesterase|nr:alpha/beta hydrolase [Spirochaetaceae bacterium]
MKKITVLVLYIVFYAGLAVPVGAQVQGRIGDFSLRNLGAYSYKASPITIQSLAFKNSLQYAYTVGFSSMGLRISARMSIPAIAPETIKGMVIMLRGHQNRGNYYTGKGTENPARGYLQRGYAVIAPDFPGYGDSSPTPAPEELHQFYSTINAVELYKSLENPDFNFAPAIPREDRIDLPGSFEKLVLWGHSNGGQVAIHFLEIIQKPVPTVLWAPVSLAFPDSFAHYRGRTGGAGLLRRDYPPADFSLFNYLHRIAPGTPILLEQGDKDRAVPKAWNDAFAKAVERENQRREQAGLGRIELRYEVYRNANHNLNPYWNSVLPLDVQFWDRH